MAHLSHLNYALSVFSFFATEALLGKLARYKREGWKPKIDGGGAGKGTGLNKHTHSPHSHIFKDLQITGNRAQKFKWD